MYCEKCGQDIGRKKPISGRYLCEKCQTGMWKTAPEPKSMKMVKAKPLMRTRTMPTPMKMLPMYARKGKYPYNTTMDEVPKKGKKTWQTIKGTVKLINGKEKFLIKEKKTYKEIDGKAKVVKTEKLIWKKVGGKDKVVDRIITKKK